MKRLYLISNKKRKPSYLTSTDPAKWKLNAYKVFYLLFGWIGRIALSRNFQSISIKGKEFLSGEPKLVLMNHSCPLDPVIISLFGRQPLQFLITESFMQGSFLSLVASYLGQITKRKLDYDMTSIRLMKEWSSCGANVALFPEGQFSWDGEPSMLMPGLDQLIKYLNLPVVCVHLDNGKFVKPAWANSSRKVPIDITVHSPISPKYIDLETIENLIFPKFQPKSKIKASDIKHRNNLMEGVARTIRFCPSCGKDQSIKDFENSLSCNSCKKSWEINELNTILDKETGEAFTTRDLFEKTKENINSYIILNKTIQSISDVKLSNITKAKPEPVGEGVLTITEKDLLIGNNNFSLNEIVDFTMDWGELILFKTKYERYSIKFTEEDSRFVFCHLLDWKKHENS